MAAGTCMSTKINYADGDGQVFTTTMPIEARMPDGLLSIGLA